MQTQPIIKKRTNAISIIAHVLVWAFAFFIPFLIMSNHAAADYIRLFKHHGLSILACMCVFYANYIYLTEKLLFRKKYISFIVVDILLVTTVGTAMFFIKELFGDPPPHPDVKIYFFLLREIFTFSLVAILSIMIKSISKWYKTEAERQEEARKRKEAELRNLRQQINPHFFFNTLNNIYALIAVSPEKAQDTVLELSKLMRYILYDNNNNYVPVYKEINFIKNYIELMRIRLTDKVEVKINIQDPQVSDKLIAPMIFISLIENAFKHGVSHSHTSFIYIDIYPMKDRLVCKTRNSYFPKDENDKSGSSIGLENLQRRLDLLYPHKHIFTIQQKDNVYNCELIIPLK